NWDILLFTEVAAGMIIGSYIGAKFTARLHPMILKTALITVPIKEFKKNSLFYANRNLQVWYTPNVMSCGKLVNEETVWDVRKEVGMVFQNPDNQFVGTTVQDDVAFGMENRGFPREKMIKR